ncbi:MAG: hypothetical protein CBARDCOR_6625 [uncultured Caballeronia sp.]|nr:MAG: hypothetical protein CBARDCOR_6625 [uncultured Caballeronia sp.]
MAQCGCRFVHRVLRAGVCQPASASNTGLVSQIAGHLARALGVRAPKRCPR